MSSSIRDFFLFGAQMVEIRWKCLFFAAVQKTYEYETRSMHDLHIEKEKNAEIKWVWIKNPTQLLIDESINTVERKRRSRWSREKLANKQTVNMFELISRSGFFFSHHQVYVYIRYRLISLYLSSSIDLCSNRNWNWNHLGIANSLNDFYVYFRTWCFFADFFMRSVRFEWHTQRKN